MASIGRAGKNRLVHHAPISEHKFRVLRGARWTVDLMATQNAVFLGLNRNTVNAYLIKLRRRIAGQCEQASPFTGAVDVDESFLGARCVIEKPGRGTYGKTIVFRIFQQKGKAYTKIVLVRSKAMLQAIIRGLNFSLYRDQPLRNIFSVLLIHQQAGIFGN